MKFELREYQKECLEDLRRFFDEVAINGPSEAFSSVTGRSHADYHAPPGMPDDNMPYVCIRVPTGGGKTFMAAHAVGIAAEHYLQRENPVCLWFAPTTTIVNQTIDALCDPNHPCRVALESAFGEGRDISCISIDEALKIDRASMESGVTVIVVTIQSIRKENLDGRKVYEENGQLMEHFEDFSEEYKKELAAKEKDGVFRRSFVNVMHRHRPIIISDEAHNSVTGLSYDSLARFNPSCIIEFTATPETKCNSDGSKFASNVLTHASVTQLKNEGMIKFPLNLEKKSNPHEAVRAAIARQEELENIAAGEERYIRPIVLYQAQPKTKGWEERGDTTVEEIERMLKSDFGIEPDEIAVQTSDQQDLKDIDLLKDDCEIRHIITVRALAEGWDCPFAYVLCSMSSYQSEKQEEQILGRILRLPYASRRQKEMLNECYVYVAKGGILAAATSFIKELVKNVGMEEMEVRDFLKLTEDNGELIDIFPPEKAPAVRQIEVPRLVVGSKGSQRPLNFEHFLDYDWSIAGEKPDVSDFYIPRDTEGKGVVDTDERGKFIFRHEYTRQVRQQSLLLESDQGWDKNALMIWLDHKIKHPDIPQAQFTPYVSVAIDALRKDYSMEELARNRFNLLRFLSKKIEELRYSAAKNGLRLMLEGAEEDRKMEVSAENAVVLERGNYDSKWNCPKDIFKKHLHPVVGELKGSGEEWECAHHIDGMEEVEVWVRNLARGNAPFWLPTSSGRFYPDFVCQLKSEDGLPPRVLVVEYKGSHLWEDAEEKREIGETWARLGGDRCLFAMVADKNWGAIEEAARAKSA